MRRRLVAVVMLPAILLLGFSPAYTLYRCTFDGAVRRQCCCPAAQEQPQDLPALEDRDCCDVEAVRAAATPAAPANAAAKVLASPNTVAALMVPQAAVRAPARLDRPSQALSPPPLERKQSLLI